MSVRITLRLRQNTSTEDDLGSPIAAGMGSVYRAALRGVDECLLSLGTLQVVVGSWCPSQVERLQVVRPTLAWIKT